MQQLIDKAKAQFQEQRDQHWHLNERILASSLRTFKRMLDSGLLESEEQVIRFSLILATEVDYTYALLYS